MNFCPQQLENSGKEATSMVPLACSQLFQGFVFMDCARSGSCLAEVASLRGHVLRVCKGVCLNDAQGAAMIFVVSCPALATWARHESTLVDLGTTWRHVARSLATSTVQLRRANPSRQLLLADIFGRPVIYTLANVNVTLQPHATYMFALAGTCF